MKQTKLRHQGPRGTKNLNRWGHLHCLSCTTCALDVIQKRLLLVKQHFLRNFRKLQVYPWPTQGNKVSYEDSVYLPDYHRFIHDGLVNMQLASHNPSQDGFLLAGSTLTCVRLIEPSPSKCTLVSPPPSPIVYKNKISL